MKYKIQTVLICILLFYGCSNKPEPVYFNGETYLYVETTEVNKVKNIFFTPDGIDLNKSSQFIQIVDLTDPDLTEQHINIIRQQLASTMALNPIKANSKYYFGMFKNRHPIYAVYNDRRFLIYSISRGFNGNATELRNNANEIFSEMEQVLIK